MDELADSRSLAGDPATRRPGDPATRRHCGPPRLLSGRLLRGQPWWEPSQLFADDPSWQSWRPLPGRFR